jgi:hypothetical protein
MPVARGNGERTRFRLVLSQPDANPPLYAWGSAPEHLRTRAQLRAAGLRPGRQGVQALLVWHSRAARPKLANGTRYAYLYDKRLARPRLNVSAAHAAAAAKATAARRVCGRCGVDRGYQPSSRLGCCNECAAAVVAA